MKKQFSQKHQIDFLFLLLLFFLFFLSALVLVLLSTNVYQHIQSNMDNNYTTNTAIAYLSEKMRQNDTNATISLATIENTSVLVITQQEEDTTYQTYLYSYNDNLFDLMTKQGQELPLKDGNLILENISCSFMALSDDLLKIQVLNTDTQIKKELFLHTHCPTLS